MEWNEEVETLLKLDKLDWAYSSRLYPISCVVNITNFPGRGPHMGKLLVVVSSKREYFAVACEKHLRLYLDNNWVLYD